MGRAVWVTGCAERDPRGRNAGTRGGEREAEGRRRACRVCAALWMRVVALARWPDAAGVLLCSTIEPEVPNMSTLIFESFTMGPKYAESSARSGAWSLALPLVAEHDG